MSKRTVDVIFDGPPGHDGGRFVEVEVNGKSINAGEWVQLARREKQEWALQIEARKIPHPALHASAPGSCQCADCKMDQEPCPDCYRVWWRNEHPETHLVGGPTARLNELWETFHKLWTNNVGLKGYDKKLWMKFESLIQRATR